MNNQLVSALADLEEAKVLELVQGGLDSGKDPMEILASCQEGMTSVGKLFETGVYFISDLVLAGEIFNQVTDLLRSRIKMNSVGAKGKVVFGTVKGDIHNIGKDLVVSLIKAADYDVLDLGVDVPPEKFVDAVKETGATVVGLSGLLTIAFDSMKDTVDTLDAAGLRPKVKVMIGGGTISATVQQLTGADAWGKDALAAVSLCNQWIKEVAK